MNVASVVVTAIVIVLTGSVLLVGLAVGARRLLGLQLGVVRTVLAGVVGSAAWLAFGLAIARPQQRPFSWGSPCWSRWGSWSWPRRSCRAGRSGR